MTATPFSATADLFYARHGEPEGGARVYQDRDVIPPAGDSETRRVRNFELKTKSVVIEKVRGNENSSRLTLPDSSFINTFASLQHLTLMKKYAVYTFRRVSNLSRI